MCERIPVRDLDASRHIRRGFANRQRSLKKLSPCQDRTMIFDIIDIRGEMSNPNIWGFCTSNNQKLMCGKTR